LLQSSLIDIITPAVEALGLELWGCEIIRHSKHSEVWVYVEGKDGGVTLDQCAAVSRQIGSLLDVEDPISGAYQLQVSSPGIDRILFNPKQYQHYLGKEVKVRLRSALNGQRNYRGVLAAADDTQITLNCGQDEQINIQFNQIEKAQLVPKF
jgi:ribosome maturation factor RimP